MGQAKYDKQGRRIGFIPNEGPQERFIDSGAFEVLFGGAAGGGKSFGLVASAIRDVSNPYSRAIIFRREFVQLQKLMRDANKLYPMEKGQWLAKDKTWYFPSGASVRFAHAKRIEDVEKYQGDDYTFVGFDELTHWPTDEVYVQMISRVRSEDKGIQRRIRATTNPGSKGHSWVKRRFGIPGSGDTVTKVVKYGPKKKRSIRQFIPSRVSDNPYYAGTDYEDKLDMLTPAQRKMLKEGRWDVVAGAMFEEFSHSEHVVKPFAVPQGLKIWRGADDGYSAPLVCLWFFEHDNTVYVCKELMKKGLTGTAAGKLIVDNDRKITVIDGLGNRYPNPHRLKGSIDASAFNEMGVSDEEKGGRAQKMNEAGCQFVPAQKHGSNGRVAGCNTVHEYLQGTYGRDEKKGKPGKRLKIFSTCKYLIETLPALPIDDKDPEDIDTESEDHAYDALRYGLQHPRTRSFQTKLVA